MEVTPHEQFATLLALILPDPTPHVQNPSINITPGVLANARAGAYAGFGHGVGEPYAFYSPDYWAHLRPVILELWRACYLAK